MNLVTTISDLAKTGGYNVPRQTVTVAGAGTSGKFPSATTPTAASPSKLVSGR